MKKVELDSSLKESVLKVQTLESENSTLKVNLQAKLQAEQEAKKRTYVASVSGTCNDWLVAAGVDDIKSASILISRESGCNPFATNKSSGAYGIPQSLPATKMASAGADWKTNPITQIKWMISYVKARYGSFAAALQHSYTKGWY